MEWVVVKNGKCVCESETLQDDDVVQDLIVGCVDNGQVTLELEKVLWKLHELNLCRDYSLVLLCKRDELDGVVEETAQQVVDLLWILNGPHIDDWIENSSVLKKTIESMTASDKDDVLTFHVYLSRVVGSQGLFWNPNLGGAGIMSEKEMRSRETIEDVLDCVEECVSNGNDTFDESDLCLCVGIAFVMNGNIVHSSLGHDDLRDAFLLLASVNFGQQSVYSKIMQVYSSCVRATGARYPWKEYKGENTEVVLEKRIAVITAFRGLVFIKIMSSLHPDATSSGHLDPYGIQVMEAALRKLYYENALQGLLDKALNLQKRLGTQVLNPSSEPVEPTRPRSRSFDLQNKGTRRSIIGSFSFRKRRKRTNSFDLEVQEPVEQDHDTVFPSPEIYRSLFMSEEYLPFCLGGRTCFSGESFNADHDEKITALRDESTFRNQHSLNAFVNSRASCSMADLERRFGFGPPA